MTTNVGIWLFRGPAMKPAMLLHSPDRSGKPGSAGWRRGLAAESRTEAARTAKDLLLRFILTSYFRTSVVAIHFLHKMSYSTG